MPDALCIICPSPPTTTNVSILGTGTLFHSLFIPRIQNISVLGTYFANELVNVFCWEHRKMNPCLNLSVWQIWLETAFPMGMRPPEPCAGAFVRLAGYVIRSQTARGL